MKGIKAWMLVGLAACAVASEVRAQGDQATPDRMTREKYSLYLERFNAGDDRYAELYDPEVVFTHAPMFGVLRGRQAIIDFYAGMRSQIKETVTASAVVIDNEHGIMAAELSTELVAKRDGVKLPSAMLNKGEKVVTRGTVYYGLRNGKVVSIRGGVTGKSRFDATGAAKPATAN
jgi:hypothetical protein